MASYRTHLTVLEQAAAQYPDSPVFRIPRIDSRSKEILEWDIVTYSQFWQDVERFARHWAQKLSSCGVHARSVVGLWYDSVSPFTIVVDMCSFCFATTGLVVSLTSMPCTYTALRAQATFRNISHYASRTPTSSSNYWRSRMAEPSSTTLRTLQP